MYQYFIQKLEQSVGYALGYVYELHGRCTPLHLHTKYIYIYKNK